jgi:hypothetical protein
MRTILEPLGNHIFSSSSEDYWATFDWKAAALFWCSDLRVWQSPPFWSITTPSGRVICHSSISERAVWCLALAEIFKHLEKTRKDR